MGRVHSAHTNLKGKAMEDFTPIGHSEILEIIDRMRALADEKGTFLLLDLYCCGGGISKGYSRAGFVVIGVDIAQRNNYPFAFIRFDAIDFLKAYGHLFDAVVGSPPCQSSTALTKGTNRAKGWGKGTDRESGGWFDLIPDTREEFARLNSYGIPTVIENVAGAQLRKDLTLCGTMFGLKVFRHRYFEVSGFRVPQPEHEKPGNGRQHFGRVGGWRHGVKYEGEYFAVHGKGGGKGSIAQWQDAMGIDWLTDANELAEAIPPAYSEYIGQFLMNHLVEKRHQPKDSAHHDFYAD
jgi:hypothetical protein